jgi:flagellar biosynthesis/type III secretory pathway protein FliH
MSTAEMEHLQEDLEEDFQPAFATLEEQVEHFASFILGLSPKIEEAVIRICTERGHAEGRAEGHAEGHAEGRAEGHLEALRATTLKILRLRFGAASTPWVERVAVMEADALEALQERALLASSLEDLE